METILENYRKEHEGISEKISRLRSEIDSLKALDVEAQRSTCNKLNELPEYKGLIGKRCIITFEKRIFGNIVQKNLEGYFGGFTFGGCTVAIIPIFSKVKTDGTRSKQLYSYYDLPSIGQFSIKLYN